jgi:hypothetical protein
MSGAQTQWGSQSACPQCRGGRYTDPSNNEAHIIVWPGKPCLVEKWKIEYHLAASIALYHSSVAWLIPNTPCCRILRSSRSAGFIRAGCILEQTDNPTKAPASSVWHCRAGVKGQGRDLHVEETESRSYPAGLVGGAPWAVSKERGGPNKVDRVSQKASSRQITPRRPV